MATLTALDPIAHLRDRRQMYLPESGSIGLFLAQRLATEAMILGATSVQTSYRGDWWSVAADCDWLTDQKTTIEELFSQLVPFPQAGVNSIRSEVLLTAFAQDVVTTDMNEVRIITGVQPSESHSAPRALRPWARIIEFRI